MSNSNETNERVPRKRGPNYTEAEKEKLMFLAKRYNDIIELKDSGTVIFKKKADAWAQIVKSYNASSSTGTRTVEQLKHLYENMKAIAKKALATSNITSKKTGEGCFIPTVQNEDLKVSELKKDQVELLHDPFDSSASYFEDDLTPETSVNMSTSNKSNERASRKRGPNYTEEEKEKFMFLVKRYDNIIESKACGTAINKKKADAWAQIAKSYNASSTTGTRTVEQLKHLYENMKQNAKKDLIARKKTGGECFIPTVQNEDLKDLELITDQVDPLHNPFDSAPSYFKDEFTPEKSIEERDNKADEPFPVENQTVVYDVIDVDSNFKEENEKSKDHNIKKNKFRTQQKTIKVSANMKNGKNYKAAYYKLKLQNAILERRRIYQDIRLRQKEHMLLLNKLKLEIEVLEKQK